MAKGSSNFKLKLRGTEIRNCWNEGSNGRQPQNILKIKHFNYHCLDLQKILGSKDQTKINHDWDKDDFLRNTNSNVKSLISQQPLIRSSKKFKLKLSGLTQHKNTWNKYDLAMEDDL